MSEFKTQNDVISFLSQITNTFESHDKDFKTLINIYSEREKEVEKCAATAEESNYQRFLDQYTKTKRYIDAAKEYLNKVGAK